MQHQLLSAGHGLIARYKGTAFDVYYIFNAITLLIICNDVQISRFQKILCYLGIDSRDLYDNTSTAGTLGLVFLDITDSMDRLFNFDWKKIAANPGPRLTLGSPAAVSANLICQDPLTRSNLQNLKFSCESCVGRPSGNLRMDGQIQYNIFNDGISAFP